MSDDFILNASPMILLGKADLLRTISPLAKSWIIPKGVVREVEKKRSIEPYLSSLSCNSQVIQKSSATIHPYAAGGSGWLMGHRALSIMVALFVGVYVARYLGVTRIKED
jgi:hypothetical protein